MARHSAATAAKPLRSPPTARLTADWTLDEWYRVLYALKAYHGICAEALSKRYRELGDDQGCQMLREGLQDTEAQFTALQAELDDGST